MIAFIALFAGKTRKYDRYGPIVPSSVSQIFVTSVFSLAFSW